MLQQFNSISKEEFLLGLLMLSTILTSAIRKIFQKKLLEILPQQECLKKQENFMNKWKNFNDLSIAMSKETVLKRLLTLQKMLNHVLLQAQNKDGAIILYLSNKLRLQSIITSKHKRFKKRLRLQLVLGIGIRPSSYLLIKLLKQQDHITGKSLNIMRLLDSMTSHKNII